MTDHSGGTRATTVAIPPPKTFDRSREAQQRLHELIPGGAHTYARGSDQYPESVTPVLVRGEGARVLDVDGNWYVEYGMGLRSVTLGHGYRPVVDAVSKAAAGGTSFHADAHSGHTVQPSVSATPPVRA